MVHIAPCTRCPLSAGCERRDELRKKARGLGARSIRFNCPILGADVRPGRRIVIRTPMLAVTHTHHDGEQHIIRHVEVNATISNTRSDYSFSAVIDAGQIGDIHYEDDEVAEDLTPEQVNDRRFRKTQSHIRIVRFLDEPDRKLCEIGNLMLPEGGCERSSKGGDWRCAKCQRAENIRVLAEIGADA